MRAMCNLALRKEEETMSQVRIWDLMDPDLPEELHLIRRPIWENQGLWLIY